jgi:hypothetical protein
MTFKVPNQYRVRTGQIASDDSWGNNGYFRIPIVRNNRPLTVIASDGLDWNHVSVSLPDRTPTWMEMCKVKSLFWDDDDAVMQLHPPRSQWVNNHNFCLHLWEPIGIEIPLPPDYLVGYKELGVLV